MLMNIIHEHCNIFNNDNLEVSLNNAIEAFFFLPCLLLNPELRPLKSNAIMKKLEEITSHSNPVSIILSKREEFIVSGNVSNQRPRNNCNPPPLSAPLPKRLQNKVTKLAQRGRLSKALSTATSYYNLEGQTLANMYRDDGEINQELLLDIQNLHPEPALHTYESTQETVVSDTANDTDQDPFNISEEILSSVISRLPKLSSTGLLSWSNELVQYLYLDTNGFEGDNNRRFKQLFLKTISLLSQGKLGSSSQWIKSLFIPLIKKNGKIRPIAVDNIFIRICGKVLSLLLKSEVGNQLLPIQYGIGIKGGCEMIVHTTTNWTTQILQEGLNGNKIIIKLDLKNAFNTIDRHAIRNGIKKYAPKLITYFDWAYGCATNINLQNGFTVTQSSTGVRQGDPLGPLLFCLGLQTELSAATNLNLKVDCYSLMDDITLFGDVTAVKTYLEHLASRLPTIGLQISFDKSAIFSTNPENISRLDQINIPITNNGLNILGCPVGTDAFVHDELSILFSDYRKYIDVVNKIPSPVAYLLLRFCINTKPSYISRTCPPWLLREHAVRHDRNIDSCIASMIEEPYLNDVSSTIRALPVKMGGLGIYTVSDILTPAWVASYTEALSFTNLEGQNYGWEYVLSQGDSALQQHCAVIQRIYPNFSFHDFPLMSKTQRDLTLAVHDEKLQTLIEKPILKDNNEHSTWFAASQKVPCPWLTSSIGPSHRYAPALGHCEMQMNLKLRMLIPIIKNRPLRCSCDDDTRNNQRYTEYHALGCIKLSGELRTERHNSVRDIIYESIKQNIPAIHVAKEANHYHPDDPRRHKKPDITLTDTEHNSDQVFIDMAVVNIGGFSYLNKNNMSVLSSIENGKRFSHKGHLDSQAYNPEVFVPFIVDTVGNIGPSGKKFLNNIVNRSTNKFMKHGILRSISISIARKNAEMYSRYIRLSQLGPS